MINNRLISRFREVYGSAPSCLVKAPGRINLIGEHTDYNGLPVLPVSLPLTVTLAVSSRTDPLVRISDIHPRYKPVSFEINNNITHSPQGHWINYCKAAVAALISYTNSIYHGMDVLIESTIPSSAGLSSSSALVIANALALLAVNRQRVAPLELAGLMAEGEKYVGTRGGGMDQAICLLGRKGRAVRLDFFPLRYTYLPFPKRYSILAAHSLVQASKTANALQQYNLRPIECRLATEMINAVYKPEKPISLLGEVFDREFFSTFKTIDEFIDATFTQDSYSLQEIGTITHIQPAILNKKYFKSGNRKASPESQNFFRLRKRTQHVLSEARRVEDACKALSDNNIAHFGELMNQSHQSCDKNYNISTPEMNELYTIMIESGVVGARMTGAGFGGFVIGLVHDDELQSCMDSVVKNYYYTYIREQKPELYKKMRIKNRNCIIFSVKPSDGAEIINL